MQSDGYLLGSWPGWTAGRLDGSFPRLAGALHGGVLAICSLAMSLPNCVCFDVLVISGFPRFAWPGEFWVSRVHSVDLGVVAGCCQTQNDLLELAD